MLGVVAELEAVVEAVAAMAVMALVMIEVEAEYLHLAFVVVPPVVMVLVTIGVGVEWVHLWVFVETLDKYTVFKMKIQIFIHMQHILEMPRNIRFS